MTNIGNIVEMTKLGIEIKIWRNWIIS